MSLLLTTTICFIVCHGGPADHFAIFAQDLENKGYKVQIYATGPALKKLQDRHIEHVTPFTLENISEEEAAAQLAQKCIGAATVITDVGHVFDIALQDALKKHIPEAKRYAYYDNPEDYVPGYSAVAAKVMRAAKGVILANANLASTALYETPTKEVELPPENKIGIGYYPLHQAKQIGKRRVSERSQIRQHFFANNGLTEQGQKVLVYAGGNNDEYFTKAFPHFLKILRQASATNDLSNYVILLQQHPGAKDKNIDANLVAQYEKEKGLPRVLVSKLNSDDAQVLGDAMLYYQTSMGPAFVLAGIPTIQVGHEKYPDILVKNGLCATATDEKSLIHAFDGLEKTATCEEKIIEKGLGIRANWAANLESAIRSNTPTTQESKH